MPEKREDLIAESLNPLLSLLDRYNIKATFFVLGIVAEKYPEVVEEIYEKGHEIASHLYSHKTLYELGKEGFEEEIEKSLSILSKYKPIGFRAPSFSINNSTKWALEILEKYGFKYDSSIFPIKTMLYGVPNAPLHIYKPSKNDITKHDPNGKIIEFPLTVFKFGKNIPIAGGFYLRVLPFWFLKLGIRKVNRDRSAIIYIHPWETYPRTPRLKMPLFSRFVTYYGINSALKKLEALLKEFKFKPIRELLDEISPCYESSAVVKKQRGRFDKEFSEMKSGVHTRIAIIGCRGIPAKYGGSETFVEEISKELAENETEVYVTCESKKFFEDSYGKIKRIHIPSIQGKMLTVPSINDMIATIYLLLKYGNKFDLVYYIAPDGALPGIIAKLFGKKVLINPDGIECRRPIKRAKYWPIYLKILSMPMTIIQWFLEALSVKVSDIVVADSYEIKKYLKKRYKKENIMFIPYGARKLLESEPNKAKELEILKKFELSPQKYYLTVARIVAENNIHMEIKGFKKSSSNKTLAIIGNFNKRDSYAKMLLKLKENNSKIKFFDPVYDKEILGILRKNCYAYIHAYEVGGTNPSLLEQMLFGGPILAFDVPFNREVLQEGGIYFKDGNELTRHMEQLEYGKFGLEDIERKQMKQIKEKYNWERVTKQYECLFRKVMSGL